MKYKFNSRHIWILLGFAAALIKVFTTDRPSWIEAYYSRGLFQGVRFLFDHSVSFLPLPGIYLFFLLLTFFLVRGIIRWVQKWHSKQLSFSLGLEKTAAFLGGVVFFFFLLWGYNYNRLPIEDHMSMKVAPLSLKQLKKELETETQELIELRALIAEAGDSALCRNHFPEELEDHLRQNLIKTLIDNGYPAEGKVRARYLYPKGVFMHFSSLGLYFPFTGEGNIDAGMHPLQKPYVATHEMSHGFGFADEGTCNFLAYISCIRSPHPAVSYAGHLSYWRTLAIQYMRYEREAYWDFRETLPAGIKADLDAINNRLKEYPDLVPRLQPMVYDAYLKTQGIKEGVLNYNRVIMLVHAWREVRKS